MADEIPTDAEENAEPADVNVAPTFIELFSGGVLGPADTDAVTLRSPAQLIVLAGAEGSGKTTVLASIYERLSLGAFAGFQFAGSRSLLGFEEICHLNRLTSGNAVPDTQRTVPAEEAAYYHVALTREGQRRHVLLSAMSGELFRLARNSREDCVRLTFLLRANTIAILIDGGRLVVPESRENAVADAAGILSSFLDAKMLGPHTRVEFVFSKVDCIVDAGEAAENFLKKTEAKLETKFRRHVPGLVFRRIAARPDTASRSELEDGLAEAFISWSEPRSPAATDTRLQSAPPVHLREFSKFGWRYFEHARRED